MINFTLVDSFAGIEDIFQRPLIVGASVSADYRTESPGKIVALQYTELNKIKVVAQNGQPAKEMITRITENSLKDRTAIIGFDLFFWDSFQSTPEPSLKAMEKLFKLAKAHHLQLILGEVPELVPHYQKSVVKINQQMRKHCNAYGNCKIIPLHKITLNVLNDGFISHNGKKYLLKELLPDGLHISRPASEYLAAEILKLYSI